VQHRRNLPLDTTYSGTVEKLVRGYTLIEVLVVVAIIGILATVLVSGVFNARRRSVDATTEAYARQVATWIAAADAAGAAIINGANNITSCEDDELISEGAPYNPPNGVVDCTVSYNDGHWLVEATSQSGRVFRASY